MKLSRTKCSLFFRVNSKTHDRLIVIRPDGFMGRVNICHAWYGHACYQMRLVNYDIDYLDSWSIFPSPEAALKAMRKYEKEMDLPEAEYIGVL